MKEKKEYQIRIPGRLVPVSKEVYLAYYRMARREQFVFEKDRRAGVAYYSDLDTEETLGEEMIPDLDAPAVETAAVTHVMREALREALISLSEADLRLIQIHLPLCPQHNRLPGNHPAAEGSWGRRLL